MKKIIAVLLCFIMLFGCASVVYAKDAVDPSKPFIEEILTTEKEESITDPSMPEIPDTTDYPTVEYFPEPELSTEVPTTGEHSVSDRLYNTVRNFLRELLFITYELTTDVYDWIVILLS